jgi:hypothetical protein
MFESMNSETVWLTITNAGLGIVSLVCIIAVGVVAGKEIYADMKEKVRVPQLQDDHSFMLSDLGITMADGGERLEKTPQAKSDTVNDETNIQRSEN